MIESDVSRHYAHGSLGQAILAGLKAMGRDTETIDPADLAGVDEFHMGGHEATKLVAEKLDLRPGMTLLDIGSGIGGPARFFARAYGVAVQGVDLTPEFVDVAQQLTRRTGLSEDQVKFRVGSATDLPFEPESFDVATMLHVGMNIADKETLFRGVHRVLKPGGVFIIYDPMRTGPGDFGFPVPWASGPQGSFLETPASYRDGLARAGFTVGPELDRRELGITFFKRIRQRIAESGPPPLGLHLQLGERGPVMMGNLIAALESGIVAPVEMISRRSA